MTTFLRRLWLAINPIARERDISERLRVMLREEQKHSHRARRMFEQLASAITEHQVVMSPDGARIWILRSDGSLMSDNGIPLPYGGIWRIK